MKIYKFVPCPGRVVGKNTVEAVAKIEDFSKILQRECVGGWELLTIMPIVVNAKVGKNAIDEPYNAFVLVKEDDDKANTQSQL